MHRLHIGPPVFDPAFGPGPGGGIVGRIVGLLFMLALFALVILAIVYLARRMRATQLPAAQTPATAGITQPAPARALLDERFARGEIDADEYSRRRALLDGPSHAV